MSIAVSVISKQEGEIKRFFDMQCYEDNCVDNDVNEWIYVYRKNEDALEFINAALDKIDNFNISLWIQIQDDDIMEVTRKNSERLIEQIISLK